MRPAVLRSALLSVCLGSGAAALAQKPAAETAAPLQLSAATDKAFYRSGEPIALKLSIHNASARTQTLVHPDYWGVTDLRVVDAQGRAVSPQTYKGERKSVASLLRISPGETQTYVFGNLTAWTCCYGYTFTLDQPGRYQLTVTVTNPPVQVKPPAGWNPGWTGTLTAAPISFEVRS